MNETDVFDMKLENKPQKQFNPKIKKFLVFAGCVILGLLLAAGGIFAFGFIFSGAPTPQEAIANYEKASLLYDVEGMIDYSSEYNKIVLHGNQECTDGELRVYLKKGYEGYQSPYDEKDMSFTLISVVEYKRGEGRYDSIMEDYLEKVPDGKDDVSAVAVVKMTVNSGRSVATRDFIAVKCGFRWYYAFGVSV